MLILDDRQENLNYNKNRGLIIDVYDPEPNIEDIRAKDTDILLTISNIKREFWEKFG